MRAASLILALLLCLLGRAAACPELCRCSRPTYEVFCSGKDLDRIPAELPEWTRRLDLSGNRIQSVEGRPLGHLLQLRELFLGRNAIHRIENGAFARLRNLRSLQMESNRLAYLTRAQLSGLEGLQALRLDANQLTGLPGAVVSALPGLVWLRVDRNPLDCGGCRAAELRPVLAKAEWPEFRSRCAHPPELASRALHDLPLDPRCPARPAVRPPRIERAPQPQESTEGNSVTFHCSASGQPPPSLAWFKDSEPLPLSGVDARSGPSPRGDRFVLGEVHRADGGVYRCVAANEGGRVEARTTLTIVEVRRPQIVSKPVDAAVAPGGTAEFACTASGRPQPRIRWIRKNVFSYLIASEGRYEVRQAPGRASVSRLRIANVSKEDEKDLIICSASSEYGSVKAGAQIRVKTDRGPPAALQDPLSLSEAASPADQSLFFNRVIEQARKEVSRAINATVKRLRDRSLRRTAADVATLFRQPNEEAIQLSRAAEIYERAVEQVELVLRRNKLNVSGPQGEVLSTRLLSDDQLGIIARLSGCQRQSEENVDCSYQVCFHKQFRALDGLCNNWRRPREGAALSPFHRLLPPEYENGVNEPLGWRHQRTYGGFPKPSARLASMKLLSAQHVTRSEKYR